MVTLANKGMIPQLITLWQKSFGDSEAYISMFLDQNFERIKTIVYVTEDFPNIPVSVAYLLPVTYVKEGQEENKCWYLYAAATLPEYRGQGFFAEILKFVETLPEPMVLVPGEESLIGYYEKQGMHKWLSERKSLFDIAIEKDVGRAREQLNSSDDSQVQVADISVEEYIALRESILANDESWKEAGYLNWSHSLMQYICHENQFCGGEIKQITIGKEHFLVMYRVDEDVVKVLELLPQTQVSECLTGLVDFVNESYKAYGNDQRCKTAEVILQPVVLATTKLEVPQEDGYFNLIMA